MAAFEKLRDRAFRLVEKSATARKLNDALGRPLATEAELADRRAFAEGYQKPQQEATLAPQREPAPVVVFTMDKQKRDADRLGQILDDAEVKYTVRSLENDPAAQAAVRRDSKGFRLPVVFVAGEVVGGRAELTNLGRAGIQKLVRG